VREPRVLIAGAGLGGLAAALSLLQRGLDVDVYEQAGELKEIGAGVQISANGTRVLFALGLEEPVREWGVRAVDKEIRLWNSGQTWSLFNRASAPIGERYGVPMFLLHRGDLHAALAEAVLRAKPGAIHLNHRCVGFEQDGGGVQVEFENGNAARGDILVGADGLHSQVRRQLFGAAVPRFTGQVVWRGLVPMEKLPEHQRRMVGTNWIGPKAHVTCYPLRRGELFNVVGQVDRDDWQIESWITEGTHAECLADFPGWHPEVQCMLENTVALYKWGLFLRDPLAHWSKGRVTLLGDACHAMLPYLGQGANAALEDGFVLGRCVAAWPQDPVAALARYEAARLERTTMLVNRSADMAGMFHNEAMADAEGAERYVNTEWHPSKIAARYDWIYKYDAMSSAI
jgi:salicylate hydroxylase